MTKITNLFLIIALIFGSFLSSSTGVPFQKRATWPQRVARVSYNIGTGSTLFGEFSFTQLAFQFTRILGQINIGINDKDTSKYSFEIYTTQSTGGTLVKVLPFKFSVNAPPGGTSAIQLDVPDIALQPSLPLQATPTATATNVADNFLRVYYKSASTATPTLLSSAPIKIVP
ncbi:2555_t:CDS:1 [Ambispora gerdemannii]|uniref:2555_t:CDS:1 n=1 Tax=Ambispora gerdemannii TaxID=144530 RepID=A0A9N9C362_9GLOM|nr:2555_t:CDS:1 [Ambispora gerdemannii]